MLGEALAVAKFDIGDGFFEVQSVKDIVENCVSLYTGGEIQIRIDIY